MNISDQEVQAYVDGELAPADAARVDAAIAADTLVAARVERGKRLRAQLRVAFDPVLDEPVPSRLAALLQDSAAAQPAPNVVPLDERRGVATARAPRWRTPAIALAASLAALAIANWLRAPSGDIAMRGDAMIARGELARGLDDALAGAPSASARVAVGLTFRDASGAVCRTFVASSQRLAGLACRNGDGWRLEVVSRVPTADQGGIRQASSGLAPAVQAAVDARMQGDAFDAAQERDARAAGWR